MGWMMFKDFQRASTAWPLADPIVEYFVESIINDWDTLPIYRASDACYRNIGEEQSLI